MQEDPVWKRRLLEPPRVERVEALGEYGVTLKILGTVRAPERWNAAGELRKRLLGAFHEHGIEIPRPQRVVLHREPSQVAGDSGQCPQRRLRPRRNSRKAASRPAREPGPGAAAT